MHKLIASICAVSWSGFWAFGYLALLANIHDSEQIFIAMWLAALGFFIGMMAWLKLSREIR